jgi:hypothetical protein
MEDTYFIPEQGLPDLNQKQRNLITSIRISKVIDYIVENNTLIDFDQKSPLVKDIDYAMFETQTQKTHYFEDLPRWIKAIIFKAEKMKHFDSMFKTYLLEREIYPKEYKSKNPKTKQDIFYDWLFLNKLDISILNIK